MLKADSCQTHVLRFCLSSFLCFVVSLYHFFLLLWFSVSRWHFILCQFSCGGYRCSHYQFVLLIWLFLKSECIISHQNFLNIRDFTLQTLLWRPVQHWYRPACVHVLHVLSDTGQVWVVQAVMCLCDAGVGGWGKQGHSCVDMAVSISPLGPAGSGVVIHTGLDYSVMNS